jgi:hypothetical protein
MPRDAMRRTGFVLPRCFRDAEVNPASLILRGPARPRG